MIGLSAQETREFFRLDERVGAGRPLPGMARDDWVRAEDCRWLELYEKHETARRPFIRASKTRH